MRCTKCGVQQPSQGWHCGLNPGSIRPQSGLNLDSIWTQSGLNPDSIRTQAAGLVPHGPMCEVWISGGASRAGGASGAAHRRQRRQRLQGGARPVALVLDDGVRNLGHLARFLRGGKGGLFQKRKCTRSADAESEGGQPFAPLSSLDPSHLVISTRSPPFPFRYAPYP